MLDNVDCRHLAKITSIAKITGLRKLRDKNLAHHTSRQGVLGLPPQVLIGLFLMAVAFGGLGIVGLDGISVNKGKLLSLYYYNTA